MKYPVACCLAVIAVSVAVSSIVSAQSPPQGSPIYGVTLPDGYRN